MFIRLNLYLWERKKKKSLNMKVLMIIIFLGNEEKKKLLYMDQYNNETNKSHETNVLCGNKIYNKCGNKKYISRSFCFFELQQESPQTYKYVML